MQFTVIEDLLVALALGLLVGLQREWSKSRVGGVRTFPLITVFGALTGILARDLGGWMVAAGLLAVAAMLVVANVAKMRGGSTDPGLTTEFAALVMYGVGVASAAGLVLPAIVTTGSVAVLLAYKQQLHAFVGRIEEADVRAAARLALIGLVILPALPNTPLGPFGVLNPFRVWLMVVLIVGISLAAYIAHRLLGARAGSWAAGLLGGLISSTATTATYSQSTKGAKARYPAAAAIVVTASAVVFVRVLVEVAVVAPGAFGEVAPPLVAMMSAMFALAAASRRHVSDDAAAAAAAPPPGLRTAMAFGLVYALVLLAVAFARTYFDARGLYAVAALSGLTDMDAITLSTMQLVSSGDLDAATGWRLVLVGSLANLAFKASIVAMLGSRELLRRVAGYFAPAFAIGVAVLWLWRG